MAPRERQEWTGHVCGLCLTLKNCYGQLSRLTTDYDAALLSALYDAQIVEPQTKRISYCPLRTSFRAEVIAADNPGVRYAASTALMMASSKIKDDIQDNDTGLRHIRGIATAVADRWMRAARESCAALGFDAGCIERQVRRQIEVEARTGRDFSFYAGPTELAAGAAFEHTAVLTGRSGNRDALREIGRMFGRIMYLLDSYEDYVTDLEAHKFNALAASCTEDKWRPQAVRIFRQAYTELKENVQRLELPRPDLIYALLIRKLRQKGYRALQLCTRDACRPPAFQSAGTPFKVLSGSDAQHEKKKKTERKYRSGTNRCCDCCYCDCPVKCDECDCCDCDCCDGCDCCGGCDCDCGC